MKNPYSVLIRPVMSEKADRLKRGNTYTFIVSKGATKPEIRNAVEKVYGVKVDTVNTIIVKGKQKRDRNMVTYSRRADYKKAFVRMKPGSRIDTL